MGYKNFIQRGAVFLLFMALMGMSFEVYSQSAPIIKNKKLPSYKSEVSEQDFLSKTNRKIEEFKEEKYVSYEVRLPVGWESTTRKKFDFGESDGIEEASGQSGENSGVFTKVATYYGPARHDYTSRFEINAVKLRQGISLKNWFLHFVTTQGVTVQGMEVIEDGKMIEALYVKVEDGVPYVIRTLAVMNGDIVVIASYYSPEKYWKHRSGHNERGFQEQVLDSFKLLYINNKKQPGRILTYKFLDILSFDYPSAWRLKNTNIFSIDGMEARLVNSHDGIELKGEIRINIVSVELDTTIQQELQYLEEDLNSIGLAIGDLVETRRDYDFYDQILYSQVEVYSLEESGTPVQMTGVGRGSKVVADGVKEHEYWLAVLLDDQYYYFVTMLTPSRNSEFLNWARNSEAFKVLVESFRF